MKMIIMALLISLTGSIAFAKADMCEIEATKVAEKFFDELYEKAKSEAEANLAEGEELYEDALPAGFGFSTSYEDIYVFSWGEQEECSCGIDVKTEKSKNGKSCKATVNEKSYLCECG